MNVLIVEDEAHTATLLKEIIEQDNNFIVVKKTASIVATVDYLSKYQQNLDLLFFDIQLADGHSFEIFNHIDVLVPIVFCTAYDEYALNAIKNNGIDYVLKPIEEEDIHQALQKYQRLIGNLRAKNRLPLHFQPPKQLTYQQSFLPQFREKTIIKKVEEIALFHLENETVYLYTFKGEKLRLLKKMEYLESVCDPTQFFRINRQMLVNRAAILSFEPFFHRKIVLQLKANFKDSPIVSRLKVSAFKEWLEQ